MGERSPLTAAQKRRYARQMLLDEIGEGGQSRLCGSHALLSAAADRRAAAVAIDYLERAGVCCSSTADAVSLALPDAQDLWTLAGGALLEEAAASLAGAFAAVEAIKQSLGVGVRAALPPHFTLGAGAGS
jgi:hypothetical protein